MVPVIKLKDVSMSLACNRTVPDDLIRRLDDIVANDVADGTADAIADSDR
jgi:hypothetical protein